MSAKRVEDIKESLGGLYRRNDSSLNECDHQYIVLSHLYSWLQTYALSAAKGILLDYGCGAQPYRQLFTERVNKYVGADVVAAKGIQLDIEFEPDQHLPLENESVDTVLSTQTLEHVKDVSFYLRECYRLLRPRGTLIITAPMQWRHHEAPYDYHRFTKFGLVNHLETHGFTIKEIQSCGGVYSLLGQIFLNHLSLRGGRFKFFYRYINRISLWLDKKDFDPDDTINWMCIAEKTHLVETSNERDVND